MNPGGGSGWDEAPLDIQIPDDARELDRDVLAYHREVRAQRRWKRLHRLAGPFSGRATVMPLLASILAVCLVAGAMLSVATFSPATAPADKPSSHPASSAPATSHSAAATASTTPSANASASGASASGASASGAGRSASPSPSLSRTASQPAPSSASSHLSARPLLVTRVNS